MQAIREEIFIMIQVPRCFIIGKDTNELGEKIRISIVFVKCVGREPLFFLSSFLTTFGKTMEQRLEEANGREEVMRSLKRLKG